jgi:uncharacterized membrane protein YoaK (UPF0700 family)
MSGIVSALADNAALGDAALIVAGLGSLLMFLAGAATSAILINWGRRRGAQSKYATPLMLEAVLLLCFGFLGTNLEQHRLLFAPATVGLLCFVMGLQNAMITKISKAEIRTTHVTGIVTDIGIELGKLVYWNRLSGLPASENVAADHARLRLLGSLLAMFLIGGLAGAFGFKHIGFVVTVPLAAMLLVLAIVPIFDDLTGLHHRS